MKRKRKFRVSRCIVRAEQMIVVADTKEMALDRCQSFPNWKAWQYHEQHGDPIGDVQVQEITAERFRAGVDEMTLKSHGTAKNQGAKSKRLRKMAAAPMEEPT